MSTQQIIDKIVKEINDDLGDVTYKPTKTDISTLTSGIEIMLKNGWNPTTNNIRSLTIGEYETRIKIAKKYKGMKLFNKLESISNKFY